jgi:hypothetical protein
MLMENAVLARTASMDEAFDRVGDTFYSGLAKVNPGLMKSPDLSFVA